MPILDENSLKEYFGSDALRNYNPVAELAAMGPDVVQALSTVGDNQLVKNMQRRLTESTSSIGRVMGAGTLATVGIPVGSAFESVLVVAKDQATPGEVALILGETIWDLVPEELKQALEDALVEASASIVEAVGASASMIPIYGQIIGAVVKAGVAIFRFVRVLKKMQQLENQEVPEDPAVFSPQLDVTNYYNLRDAVVPTPGSARGVDLTYAFSPPQYVPQGAFDQVIAVPAKKLTTGGYRFAATNLDEGLGYLPYSNFLHRAVEVGPLSGPEGMRDTGSLFPVTWTSASSLRHLTAAFGYPQVYKVNWQAVRDRWSLYLRALRSSLEKTLGGDELDRVIKWLGSDPEGPQFGWSEKTGILDPTQQYGPQAYGIDDPAGEYDGTPNKAKPLAYADTMLQRQLDALDTVNVAYCSKDDPAFQGGTPHAKALRDLLELRRKQLLEHPALCSLDQANIPDAMYRSSVEAKLMFAPVDYCAPKEIAAKGFAKDIGQWPPPEVPGPEGSGGSSVADMSEGSFVEKYGTALAVAGLSAPFVWGFLQKYRRKR